MNQLQSPAIDDRRRAGDFVLGLFLFVAFVSFLGAWLWLKSEPIWKPAQRFNVLFHDVSGLNENAAVYSDGVRIGSVESIDLQGKHQVLVRLKINQEKLRIPQGSKFHIYTNGFVGAKYVDVSLPYNTHNAALLTPDSVARGEDPAHPELLVNQIASNLSKVDFERLEERLDAGMVHVSAAADQVSMLSAKLHPVADKAKIMEDRITALAGEMHKTSNRINKLLENPKLAEEAKETLSRLDSTTAHVEAAITKLEQIANNSQLRADVKETVENAKETVAHVHAMVEDPRFGTELKDTMTQARSALSRLDLVGRQFNQILGKRAPLLHMLFGKPGAIKRENEQSAGTSETVPQ